MTPDKQLLERAFDALAHGEQAILCTVVDLQGNGYGKPGARLLLTESGERLGYISGGCLERDLCRQVWSATADGPALLAFDTRQNRLRPAAYNTGCEGVVAVLCRRLTTGDPGLDLLAEVLDSGQPGRLAMVYRSSSPDFAVGTIAGGIDGRWDQDQGLLARHTLGNTRRNQNVAFTDAQGHPVQAFVEAVEPPQKLLVIGAGDDVQPLVAAALQLQWRVTVVARHPDLAQASRFNGAEVHCARPAVWLQTTVPDARTLTVLMSHDFTTDCEVLPHLLASPAPFIGILGPKRRLARLVTHLHRQGTPLSAFDIERIRAPVGLDIGAVEPREIAVSIIAELLAFARAREGQSLHWQTRATPGNERARQPLDAIASEAL